MKDYLTESIGDLIKNRKDLTPGAKYAYKKQMISDLLVADSDTFSSVSLDAPNSLEYAPVDPNSIVVYKESTSTYYQRYDDWTCDPAAGTITFLSTGDIEAGFNIVVEYKYYKATVSISANEILTLIKTVDGTGSGLDADTVDGMEASEFAAATHAETHENGGADEIDVGGLSGELADDQPPKAHDLAGSKHNQCTLAELNAKISDATLDDDGDERTDGDAIHDNVAAEINAIAEKASPVSGDLLIIEDSESSNAKKKVQIGNLPGGAGSDNDITPEPGSDNGYEGFYGTMTAGETLAAGDLCYLSNDGKFYQTAADDEETLGGLLAICTEALDEDDTGVFVLHGFFRHDAWSWNVGATLYMSDTDGEFSETAGSTSRIMGTAYSDDCIYFNPDNYLFTAPAAGRVYGFFGGGSSSNIIDYINITTTSGNAADKGDRTVSKSEVAGCAGDSYGFFGGGISFTNVVDYIDITTTSGNATDTGDLTVSRGLHGAVNGATYGFFGGGHT